MAKLGETIPLSVQLHDGAIDKYCRAIVRDSDGTALAGSPVTLTHISNGKYEDNTLVMPNKRYVSVTYEVYEDALFTTLSDEHTHAVDLFELEVLDQNLIDLLEELKTLLEQILNAGISVVGANVTGFVSDTDDMGAEIHDTDEVDGEVSDDDEATAIADDDDLTGQVVDVDDIEGNIGGCE